MSAQANSRAGSVDSQDRQPEAQSPSTQITVNLTQLDDNEVPETQQSTNAASSTLKSTPETVVPTGSRKRKGRVGLGAGATKRLKKRAVHFDETLATKPGTGSHPNPESPTSAHDEIQSPKRGAESTTSELGLLSESVRELRGLITILGKRLDLVEETIRKTDARLSNRIIDLEESVDEAKNDVEEIDEKVSGMITDRDHVITALARMVNNELGPGYSA